MAFHYSELLSSARLRFEEGRVETEAESFVHMSRIIIPAGMIATKDAPS